MKALHERGALDPTEEQLAKGREEVLKHEQETGDWPGEYASATHDQLGDVEPDFAAALDEQVEAAERLLAGENRSGLEVIDGYIEEIQGNRAVIDAVSAILAERAPESRKLLDMARSARAGDQGSRAAWHLHDRGLLDPQPDELASVREGFEVEEEAGQFNPDGVLSAACDRARQVFVELVELLRARPLECEAIASGTKLLANVVEQKAREITSERARIDVALEMKRAAEAPVAEPVAEQAEGDLGPFGAAIDAHRSGEEQPVDPMRPRLRKRGRPKKSEE